MFIIIQRIKTMKILKHGNMYDRHKEKKNNYRYETRICPKCKCKFHYDLWTEIESDNHNWVRCPECNVRILLDDNNSNYYIDEKYVGYPPGMER